MDPRNRPEWQASLLSVQMREREEEPHVGQQWTDITMVGARPRMETTVLMPYRLFEERGRWHGLTADLSMRFTAVGAGCRISVTGALSGSGPWGAVAVATARAAGPGIAVDLRRAGRVLSDRGPL